MPLLGILRLAPWLSEQTLAMPGYSPISRLEIPPCYCLAGFLIGYVCESEKFTWIMLVTYVPAHLVAGWTFGWFPYSTAAFACAYFATQARRRAKLVLQS